MDQQNCLQVTKMTFEGLLKLQNFKKLKAIKQFEYLTVKSQYSYVIIVTEHEVATRPTIEELRELSDLRNFVPSQGFSYSWGAKLWNGLSDE